MSAGTYYSFDEDQIIREHLITLGASKVAAMLGRKPAAVEERAYRLRLTGNLVPRKNVNPALVRLAKFDPLARRVLYGEEEPCA